MTPISIKIGSKRALPSTSGSSDIPVHPITNSIIEAKENDKDLPTNLVLPKHSTKKLRSNSPALHSKPSMEELLSPIMPIMLNNPENFPLNFVQLCSFLEKSHGSSKVLEIAREYIEDTNSITALLHQIYPHLKQSSIKNRITRIIKKLQQINNTSNMEFDSDATFETDEETK